MKKRISRVVTKTGDQGQTSLADGTRLSKADPRMHAMGTVDELNTFVGVLITQLPQGNAADFVTEIQQSLFDLGGSLAFPSGGKYPDAEPVEVECRRLNDALPPLTEFVLPGGTPAAAAAHVCRAVCRRAERCMWELDDADTHPGAQYLNRLSDYFFVLSRELNAKQGEEAQWRGPKGQE